MRRIINEFVSNMRPLDGYVNKENKQIKSMSLIRSNLPFKMSETEINYLLTNNIKTIIDFRTKEEINNKPSILNNNKFNYYNISLKGHKCPKYEKDIPSGYIEIIDDKEKIKEVLMLILNSKTIVLYHCTSGKDRTGVITMLIMLILNCYEKDIIADYSLTYSYIYDDIKRFHELNPKLPKFIGNSKPSCMIKTLKLFFNKYKTIDNYLNYLDLPSNFKEEFQKKYLNVL